MNLQPAVLENDIIIITPLTESDFDRLFAVASDPLIWEQHPSNDRYKKEVFRPFFDGAVASGTAFLIFDKKTNKLIGSTRFYDYKPDEASIAIGYTFIAKEYWGGNYNGSAKKLLLDYAFEFVNTVIFQIGSTNTRSQKAILKIGAEKAREVELEFNGKKSLHYEYEIKKENWIAW